MRYFTLGMMVMLMLIVGGVLAYLLMGFAEVRADVPPSGFETWLMYMGVHAAVRRQAPNVANPFAPTDGTLIAGGKLYLGECAGCHGSPGKQRKYPTALNPPAPQFPTVGTEYSEPQVFWVAKHGVRHTGMFFNGAWNSDDELWRVTAYIKRMSNLPQAVQNELSKNAS
jgi:mono/diheme cytochrome c family protein